MTSPLRVALVASEVAGFAKTGGLADVAGSLPRALAERGIDVAVFLPLYRSVRLGPQPLYPTEHAFSLPMGYRKFPGKIWRSTLPGCAVPVYLIEQTELFERDDPARGTGLYQWMNESGQRIDYEDNSSRFAFFCRSVLESFRLLNFWPQVAHINDWQTGLLPVYLKEFYHQSPGSEERRNYRNIRLLCTIHNLAYQGMFWHHDMPQLHLPWKLFNLEQLEFHGHINFLKAGIVFSDLISTVSPTYAREIQTRYYGCGLEGVLRNRMRHLFGIVNGVDYSTWDPGRDPHLPDHYTADTLDQGKAACKAALQQQLNLAVDAKVPVVGIISRMVDQKGWDLIQEVGDRMLSTNIQFVVLGEGDSRYEQFVRGLGERHPHKVRFHQGYHEALAHRIEAGADLFLMPSRYEPCGLNQLYSLRYGTIPLVRATGGLADTVVDASEGNLASGTATGFAFVPYSGAILFDTLLRALHLYHHDPAQWRKLQIAGMKQDWSWNRSAQEYENLYQRLTQRPLS